MLIFCCVDCATKFVLIQCSVTRFDFSAAFFVNVRTVVVLIIQYVLCFMLDASSDITYDKTCEP
jgi:hypothetical protein